MLRDPMAKETDSAPARSRGCFQSRSGLTINQPLNCDTRKCLKSLSATTLRQEATGSKGALSAYRSALACLRGFIIQGLSIFKYI